MIPFTKWLAALLKQNELEVQRLLRSDSALHFLVAWSLFESKCFNGYLKAQCLQPFAIRIVGEGFPTAKIAAELSHFHDRYQDKKKLENLLQGNRTPAQVGGEFKRLVTRPVDALTSEEQSFLVACVVYRYRNNIFHGYKGVESWLRFKPQIRLCTSAMQAFVLHAESCSPTMAVGDAA